MSFHTNRAILSATFSNFKADKKCGFESFFFIFYGIIPPYYRVFFSTFWTFNKCDFIYFFPWKTRIVRFLVRIAFQLSVFFCRFHFLFFIFRFSFFVFRFSVFVFVFCFPFFVFWFRFLLFVFRFSLFVFFFCIVVLRQASSARRPSLYSQNEAKRALRPGNSAIFIIRRTSSLPSDCVLTDPVYIFFLFAERNVVERASWQFRYFFFFIFAERSEARAASWQFAYFSRTMRSERSVLAIRLYYIF